MRTCLLLLGIQWVFVNLAYSGNVPSVIKDAVVDSTLLPVIAVPGVVAKRIIENNKPTEKDIIKIPKGRPDVPNKAKDDEQERINQQHQADLEAQEKALERLMNRFRNYTHPSQEYVEDFTEGAQYIMMNHPETGKIAIRNFREETRFFYKLIIAATVFSVFGDNCPEVAGWFYNHADEDSIDRLRGYQSAAISSHQSTGTSCQGFAMAGCMRVDQKQAYYKQARYRDERQVKALSHFVKSLF